jgi:hypothetical protein
MRNPNVKCIPLATAEEMKKALRNGDIVIKDLYNMDSVQRREAFEKFASKDLSKEINTMFEKAMVSKQKTALKDWADKVFSPKEKEGQGYKDVIQKIEDLDSVGALGDQNAKGFLSDLVSDSLGITVSPEQIKEISTRAKDLEEKFNLPTNDGIPSVEYWSARKGMDDYIASITPTNALKVTTSISGRGAMLFSIKSPLTNIISNTVQGITQAFERRIASGQYKGANGDFALEYVKKVTDIYQKSGYDISRMESIGDGQKRRGEEQTSAQGPGVARAIGRWYEDVVFKQLMGAPDVVSSSVAFADSANLSSTKIAGGDKAKALEIFKDATRIDPQTVNGEIVRAQAIADAKYSTYTNDGGYSDFAMAIRSALNNATGNIRLGDQLMPFVKTPANVVQAGVDAAGVGVIRAAFKLQEAVKEMKQGNGDPMKDVVRLAVRSGLGMTLATMLAFMFDTDDFTGEYEGMTQKGRDMAKAKNAPYNSIKMGDKYVSLDYFGPLASSFVGIMYARKYGESLPSSIFQYGIGVGTQALKVPGLRDFGDLVQNITNAVQRGKMVDVAGKLTDEGIAYVRARVVPAIVNDFAKGTDLVERDTGRDALAKVKSSIPGLRQSLPEKINQLTGESVKGEGLALTLLFGSRVKTATNNPVVSEISSLYEADATPTISDISYSSKRMKELKEQIGNDSFNDALKFYGEQFSEKAEKLIESGSYKASDNDKKRKELNKVREQSLDRTLSKFGYKKTKNQ